MAQKLKTRSITGENQFTDACEVVGYFNVSITGTWQGRVTVQRSFDWVQLGLISNNGRQICKNTDSSLKEVYNIG